MRSSCGKGRPTRHLWTTNGPPAGRAGQHGHETRAGSRRCPMGRLRPTIPVRSDKLSPHLRGTSLHEGLYESVVTSALQRELIGSPISRLRSRRSIPPIRPMSCPTPGEGHPAAIGRRTRPRSQVGARKPAPAGPGPGGPPCRGARSAAARRSSPARARARQPLRPRPKTPLDEAALLTNAHGEPSLAAELRAEIDSADSIDLLCAFVKWYGLRLLEPARAGSRRRVSRSASSPPPTSARPSARPSTGWSATSAPRSRSSTTPRAPGCTPRPGCSGATPASTRPTSGRSNLSRAALLDGVEWNVRLSRQARRRCWRSSSATFDTYWNDLDLRDLRPRRAIATGSTTPWPPRGRPSGADRVTISLVRPRGAALPVPAGDARRARRRARRPRPPPQPRRRRHRHRQDRRRRARLPPAARSASGDRPRLLFVAHRREILEQSLRTYREVLADGDFGELYVGGARPERWRHVFASVQSLTSYGVANIPRDAFDVVVIDEFHHAEAATYRRLLDHLQPRELLGLTATPERADGVGRPVSFFDGRTAAELRLWDALERRPARAPSTTSGSPTAPTSADRVDARRYDDGRARAASTPATTRERAIVLRQLRDKVVRRRSDAGARLLRQRRARRVHGHGLQRGRHPGASRHRRRRPPASATKRLRTCATAASTSCSPSTCSTRASTSPTSTPSCSCGRPRAPRSSCSSSAAACAARRDKAVLTVLDFVGHHRKEFRFDQKLARPDRAAPAAGSSVRSRKASRSCPSGCQIELDRSRRTLVLENIRSQIANRWQQIVAELRSLRRPGPADVPARSPALELCDVLRRGSHSWTAAAPRRRPRPRARDRA